MPQTNKLDKYQDLQDKAARLRRDADKADGALEQLMARLSKEFKVDNLKAAKKKLQALENQADEANKEFHKAVEQFEEDWGDVLNNG